MILRAIATVVIIGAVGVGLLYLASQDMLPAALGLLDMEKDINRVFVIIGLLVVGAVLAVLYKRLQAKNRSKEDVNAE